MRLENHWDMDRMPLMITVNGLPRAIFVDPYASGLRFKDGEPGVSEQLRHMAEMLADQYGLDEVIVAGGRFFAHPWRKGISLHQEWMLWYDKHSKHEELEQVLTEKTNYSMITVSKIGPDVDAFLNKIGFPGHALVVRTSAGSADAPVFRGLKTMDEVVSAFQECAEVALDGRIILQTDMRANYNPTRLQVIKELTEKLSDKIHLFKSVGEPLKTMI